MVEMQINDLYFLIKSDAGGYKAYKKDESNNETLIFESDTLLKCIQHIETMFW